MNLTGKAQSIAATLKAGISDGKFPAESPLPSVVQLMRRFGVARATAVAALKELERDGFAESRQGCGTFPVVRAPTVFGVVVSDPAAPLCAAICSGIANCAKNAGGGVGIIRCYGRTAPRRLTLRTSASRPAWRARSLSGRGTPV